MSSFSTTSLPFVTAIAIFQGEKDKYYVYDGVKYDIRFPLNWALKHLRHPKDSSILSGPAENGCNSCKYYGSINGVFVGYCEICSKVIYNGSRPGFHNINELTDTEMWDIFPYMAGVSKKDIGDKDEQENQEQDDEAQDTQLYNRKREQKK